MIQLLIDGLASFIGGYLLGYAKKNNVSIRTFFIYAFLLMLIVSLLAILISGNFSIGILLLCLSISFVCALMGCLILKFSLRKHDVGCGKLWLFKI